MPERQQDTSVSSRIRSLLERRLVGRIAYCALAAVLIIATFIIARNVSFSSTNAKISHTVRLPLRWYADSPEGIRFFDSSGYDPKYGVKLRPGTPDLRVLLERRHLERRHLSQ